MPVCYFDDDFTKKFNCEYEISENNIIVDVSYCIADEIEPINGIRSIGSNTEYKDRDILIIDYKNSKNYLLMDAYYNGHSTIMGTPDGGDITKFKSHIYFEHNDLNKLSNLPKTPKIRKIRIYSKSILDYIGCRSLKKTINDETYSISLSKKRNTDTIIINKNYIKSISVGDEWSSAHSSNDSKINIDLTGFLEIELTKRINYSNIYEFIHELQIFMQLYSPNKFIIDKIDVMIDDSFYRLHLYTYDFNNKRKQPQRSVDDNILDFLKKCYEKIPYRNSKTEIRNIPYIIMDSSRNIEDNFLMFYRFIECYYKKTSIEGIKKTFISYSLNKHYPNNLTNEDLEDLSLEIIKLRNHYVHSGYYIKNSKLSIIHDKINGKKNPRDYTVTGIDGIWIYNKSKILYKIVVDIIFKEMLNYNDYDFTHMF